MGSISYPVMNIPFCGLSSVDTDYLHCSLPFRFALQELTEVKPLFLGFVYTQAGAFFFVFHSRTLENWTTASDLTSFSQNTCISNSPSTMPPRPKTVSLYIEHEQKWRGKSSNVQKTLRREWAAKTAQQRTTLARRLTEAHNARTIVRAHEPLAQLTWETFQEGEPYADDQTLLFRHRLKAAIDAWKTLSGFQDAEKDAWGALRAEQESQGMSDKSLRFTEKCQKDSDARAARFNVSNEISGMIRLLDRPPLPISEGYGGRRRMPEKWVSSRTRNVRIRRRLVGDSNAGRVGIRPRHDGEEDGEEERTWSAQKQMSGGQAKVSLWLQVDQNNLIVDRLAKKEQYYDSEMWFEAKKWEADVKDENSRRPWEIVTHEALSNVRDLGSVVRFYEPSNRRWVDNNARRHITYLEWCPHGDLQDLIKD